MNTLYVTMHKVRVVEASVYAAAYSSGMPAMTAVAGFAHALSRKLADEVSASSDDPFADDETLEISFVPVQSIHGLAKRVVYQHTHKPGLPAPGAFDPIADMQLELVLEVRTSLTEGSLTNLLGQLRTQRLVSSLRFAGGTLLWAGDAETYGSVEDAFASLHGLGFVLEDATATLMADMSEGASVLGALHARVARPVFADNRETPEYAPRFVPVAVGFMGLEPPTVKPGIKKQGLPHAFVEPVLGLGRLRLAASANKEIKRNGAGCFIWRHDNTIPNFYLVSAR
jgi:hypothetical protein